MGLPSSGDPLSMPDLDDRRYGIAEVSELVGVQSHVLRQWETRFPPFKPRRDRANRRIYSVGDIEIARRIKQLLREEKMTSKGAAKRLEEELKGEGRPKTNTEALDLIDKIDQEVRAIVDILDKYEHK